MELSAFLLFLLPGFLITHVKVTFYMQRKKTETIRWVESLLISPIFYAILYRWDWTRENVLSGIIEAFKTDSSIFSADTLYSVLYLSVIAFFVGYAYQWFLRGLSWLVKKLPKKSMFSIILRRRKNSFDSAWNEFFAELRDRGKKTKMVFVLSDGKKLTGYCRSIAQDFGDGHRDVWMENVVDEKGKKIATSMLVDASQVLCWYYL